MNVSKRAAAPLVAAYEVYSFARKARCLVLKKNIKFLEYSLF